MWVGGQSYTLEVYPRIRNPVPTFLIHVQVPIKVALSSGLLVRVCLRNNYRIS